MALMGKKKIKKLESQVEALQAKLAEMAEVVDSIAATQKKISVKVLAALDEPAGKKTASKEVKKEEAPKRSRRGKTSNDASATKETAPVRRGRPKKTETAAAKEAPKAGQRRGRKPAEPSKAAPAEKKEAKPLKAAAEPAAKRAASPAPAEKKAVKGKTERAPRTDTVILYNCDEAKSPESMFNRGDEVFRDSIAGRRALLKKLKTEIAEGRIALLNNYPPKIMQIEVLDGRYDPVNKHLQYGFIAKVSKTAK